MLINKETEFTTYGLRQVNRLIDFRPAKLVNDLVPYRDFSKEHADVWNEILGSCYRRHLREIKNPVLRRLKDLVKE